MIFTPDMSTADTWNADVEANAVKYTASLFLGRGEYANAEAISLNDIRAAAEQLKAEHPSVHSQPIISAIDAAGNKTVLGGKPKKVKPTKKAKAAPKAAKAPKVVQMPKALKAAKAEKAAKEPKAAKPVGQRAQIEADAANGKLPAAPDFSAATHARFRKKLDEIVALAKAGDIAALKAYPINPVSSSPKAMDRYRNLAVIALEAKAAKA